MSSRSSFAAITASYLCLTVVFLIISRPLHLLLAQATVTGTGTTGCFFSLLRSFSFSLSQYLEVSNTLLEWCSGEPIKKSGVLLSSRPACTSRISFYENLEQGERSLISLVYFASLEGLLLLRGEGEENLSTPPALHCCCGWSERRCFFRILSISETSPGLIE